jgi:hypothetical protein
MSRPRRSFDRDAIVWSRSQSERTPAAQTVLPAAVGAALQSAGKVSPTEQPTGEDTARNFGLSARHGPATRDLGLQFVRTLRASTASCLYGQREGGMT